MSDSAKEMSESQINCLINAFRCFSGGDKLIRVEVNSAYVVPTSNLPEGVSIGLDQTIPQEYAILWGTRSKMTMTFTDNSDTK